MIENSFPSVNDIQEQLELVLNSPEFFSSGRLKDFLTYIVNEDLAGRGERIKSYNIGVEVFHLGKNFGPYVNPAVRVHAGRLRIKLESYYRFSGNPGRVLITIPKGSYRPRFSYISQADLTDPPTVAKGQNPQAIPLAAVNEVSTDEPAAPELEQKSYFSGSVACRPCSVYHPSSVLVLPLSNIYDEKSLGSFIQGLTKTLIMELNRFEELKVFTVKTDSIGHLDIWKEAEKVGSRFILSGSVHLDVDALRLHIALIDAQSREYVWADKFDGKLHDSAFHTQDTLASQIVARVADSFGSINRTLFEEQLKKSAG